MVAHVCCNDTTPVFIMTLEEAQQQKIAPWDNVVEVKPNTVVFADRYPCTPGHLLFVPKQNSNLNWIVYAMADALAHGTHMVEQGKCDGFNIGFNSGTAAGQTVMYPHVHLIPRREGDVEDPVGGVRNTIPGKGNYKK